ncbi:MAG TPA: YetF domain-containing protein [Actinomycetales bacterium]|nr:YetF domain-containing protein [Actinomycetales bacterium]
MEIVIRAVVVFLFLWLITRIVGRSTLGEISTFQLIVFITMGDLVQQAVTQQDYSVTGAALAVGTFAVLTIAISWVNQRWPRVRPVTQGTPVVLVVNGEPQMQTLQRERMSIDDLYSDARQEGIERLSDVRLAVLETNGQVSFFTGEPKDGAAKAPAVG